MKTGKLCKRIVTALLFSLITTTGCDAKGAENPAHKAYKLPLISDVETVVSASKKIELRRRSIGLSLLYESTRGKPIPYIYKSHSPRFVESVVKKTSDVMDTFLREKGVTHSECRGYKYNLIVIVVSKDVLQDDNRFRNFYKRKFGVEKLEGRSLYGYYDSTPEVANNSSILLTDVGPYLNEQVLVHELAHYWWDRLCVTSHISGTSEGFARAFESYYMRSR